MARDKVIDSLTAEAQEDSVPAAQHDAAEVMDVSLVRDMMMRMQMEAGEQLGAQLAADVEHTREVQEELLFEMLDSNKDTPMAASTALRTLRASRTLRNSRIPPTMTMQVISTRSWSMVRAVW